MNEIISVTGTGVPLLWDDIDTDRIIPARYLRCVTFEGLGEHAFADDRKQDSAHPFDEPRYRNARILVAGRNFGCGSSREHAPQALLKWGIRAVIGESFAEIFFGNCTSLGMPAVCAERSQLQKLADAIQADANLQITLDVERCEISFADDIVTCTMPESARESLVTGQYDALAQLLTTETEIRETAGRLPYLSNFT